MEVAHNNGPSIKEQQLTKGDVSVLVDKCVNFVYTHGKFELLFFFSERKL